jgi:thiosulfate reductase cytochrome b subunit
MAMAGSAYLPGLETAITSDHSAPRHSGVVRITHWINTVSFFGLLVSGFAILLAHPRFYWGETGALGTPSLIDLPLPFMRGGPSGWGRNLHFLSAWVSVINGLFYVVSSILTRHFRKDLVPARADLAWGSVARVVSNHLRLRRPGVETSSAYDVLQRLAYLVVIFVLLPVTIWTGLAMSPAIVSVFPAIVTVLGGQQSARTLHFFAADFLVVFLLVHITMICVAGFKNRVGAMITGHTPAGEERT